MLIFWPLPPLKKMVYWLLSTSRLILSKTSNDVSIDMFANKQPQPLPLTNTVRLVEITGIFKLHPSHLKLLYFLVPTLSSFSLWSCRVSIQHRKYHLQDMLRIPESATCASTGNIWAPDHLWGWRSICTWRKTNYDRFKPRRSFVLFQPRKHAWEVRRFIEAVGWRCLLVCREPFAASVSVPICVVAWLNNCSTACKIAAG